jgi:hypothetical protein
MDLIFLNNRIYNIHITDLTEFSKNPYRFKSRNNGYFGLKIMGLQNLTEPLILKIRFFD